MTGITRVFSRNNVRTSPLARDVNVFGRDVSFILLSRVHRHHRPTNTTESDTRKHQIHRNKFPRNSVENNLCVRSFII